MKGNEQLKEYGKRLRLYHLCNHMDELLHVAQQDKPTYHEFLMGLLEREITCREKKDYERRLSAARLPQRQDRKSTRLNSSHKVQSRMPSSA